MKYINVTAALLACSIGALTPAVAKDPTKVTGSLTSTDVGVSPIVGQSATDYVTAATDGDLYEIASSRLALSKTKNPNVKSFARQMIADHTTSAKSVEAALVNSDRKITKPSTKMSSVNTSKIELLKKAPKGSFDQLYMQQQQQAHQVAWSIQKGYVLDGNDPALKQVASTTLPVIERHIVSLKGGQMSGM